MSKASKPMSNNNQKTACIIGGGMSGLFTGALLAKNGYKVTVLEKNHIIGGGLQSFRRGDAVFNTGMQAFCGYDDNFTLPHFLDYVGINRSDLKIVPTDNDAQEIVWVDKSHCFKLPKGRLNYEKYLTSQFPDEADGIHKLLDCIYEIGNTFDYFYMRRMQQHPEAIQYAQITAEKLIRQYVKNETLVKLFGYVGPHLGYNLKKLPATELGMILTLYIEGSYRFADGNIQLAHALEQQISNTGGAVISDSEVTKIECSNNKLQCVYVRDTKFSSDTFVWACAPDILYKLGGENIFRSSTNYRIKTYSSNSSNYNIYIKFKKNNFPYINSWVFIPSLETSEDLPLYIAFITHPTSIQTEYAKTMEVCIPTHFSDFRKWKNTTLNNRTTDYEQMKQQFGEKVINYISKFYPELQYSVETIEISTPLTIRDFYGNPNGATYGQQGLFMPIKTKIKNLFLTGQAIQYQGLFGVMATSITTAETILGKNLIEEIAAAK